MPLQNRVDPFGALFATVERGQMMGNRGGRFHDLESRQLHSKQWVSKQWICCAIVFRGRQRAVWGKSYTELFFSDDVAALSAGHRPCFECRRKDAVAFAAAWGKAYKQMPPRAAEMDAILHEQRLKGREKRLHSLAIETLPDGSMFLLNDKPLALRAGKAFPWQFNGYGPARPRPPSGLVSVLTPPAIIACLAHGYKPR